MTFITIGSFWKLFNRYFPLWIRLSDVWSGETFLDVLPKWVDDGAKVNVDLYDDEQQNQNDDFQCCKSDFYINLLSVDGESLGDGESHINGEQSKVANCDHLRNAFQKLNNREFCLWIGLSDVWTGETFLDVLPKWVDDGTKVNVDHHDDEQQNRKDDF